LCTHYGNLKLGCHLYGVDLVHAMLAASVFSRGERVVSRQSIDFCSWDMAGGRGLKLLPRLLPNEKDLASRSSRSHWVAGTLPQR